MQTAKSSPTDAVLATLVGQALAEGATPLTMRALVEEASEAGAARALANLGLADARAGGDIYELRQLLLAWRDLKCTARRAVVGWAVKVAVTGLLIGLMLELKALKLFGA